MREVLSYNMLFPALLSSVTTTDEVNYYAFSEQIVDYSTGDYGDLDGGRSGIALEVNNLLVSVPCYVWIRLAGIVGGEQQWEFDAGQFPSTIPSDVTFGGDVTYDSGVEYTSSSTTTYDSGSTVTNDGTYNSSGGNLIIPTSIPSSPVAGSMYLSGGLVVYTSPTSTVTSASTANTSTWTRYTITHSSFTSASTTQTITVGTIPTLGVVQACIVRCPTNFTGGALASFTITVLVGSADFIYNYNCYSNTTGNNQTSYNVDLNTLGLAGANITLEAASTGDDVNAATAGEFDLWLQVIGLP